MINNQIGFITSPSEGRSRLTPPTWPRCCRFRFSTSTAKIPEAVAQVVRLAMDFRHEFKRDVVIDMYCYRRRGHNESDEPAFTHPLLYRAIEKRKSVREGYLAHLVELGGVTKEEADQIAAEQTAELERELSAAKSSDYVFRSRRLYRRLGGLYRRPEPRITCPTPIPASPRERLCRLLEADARVPAEFPSASQNRKVLEQPAGNGPRQTAARLGDRRGAGVRHRWPPKDIACDSAARIRPAARSASVTPYCTTIENGAALRIAAAPVADDQAPVEHLQQPAVGNGRAGFRLWL